MVFAEPALGRRHAADITIYMSLGRVVQDLAAVCYLDARSRDGCA